MLFYRSSSPGGWGEHYCKGTFGRSLGLNACLQKCKDLPLDLPKKGNKRKVVVPKWRPIRHDDILNAQEYC